jgi:hypothetical protein
MQVGTLYLFPLSKIDSHLGGYFVSAEGTFYSTKQSVAGRKMTGSGSFGSRTRYYTMNGRSYEGAVLYRRAQGQGDWKVETTKPSETIATMNKILQSTKQVSARSHAASASLGIKGRGVVIARVATHDGVEHLLFGSQPALHMTEQSYTDEMTRLATQYPGVEFVALKVVKSVKAGGFTWG